MANERYLNRTKVRNRSLSFAKIFENRDVRSVVHYATPNMRYPSIEEISNLITIAHKWKIGDRFWRLAATHYSDPELWWVIAWFNKKPTEAHTRFGEVIYVPLPLTKVLQYYGV